MAYHASDKLPRYSIPNLANACRTLKFLGSTAAAISISDISRELRIPRTTVLRIVSTLAHASLLRETPDGFVLGPALIPLGARALEKIDLRRTAAPILRTLAVETDETAHLAVPAEGFKSLLVEVAHSPHPIRVGAPAGTLADLYCSATGKIFLAYCFAERLPEFFKSCTIEKRTARTITTPTAMRREIKTIRVQHYAVDEEEFMEGIRCLAVPVRDNTGAVAAAIGITGPATRFTRDKIPAFAQKLSAAAARLSHNLGGG